LVFWMGESEDETPAHKVKVKSFYMSESEVTQQQWVEVMGNNPSYEGNLGADHPVTKVNFYDVLEFIKALNFREKTDKYRLPTEEEWEYAARAGTTTRWCSGDNKKSVDKYLANDWGPVKSKKPNQWGLYDMHGNVWEWTNSCYTNDYKSDCVPNTKVRRSGMKFWTEESTRSAYREDENPNKRALNQGFRLLMEK